MADYIKLLTVNHPTVQASCLGDKTDYNNITFLSGSVDKATLDSEYLDYYKQKKNNDIDIKTKELIEQGFVYDSTIFSTSETAQRNWMAMDQLRADLTYPFAVSTKSDGEYIFADTTEIHSFVLTGMGTIDYHYSSGRALKLQVNAATTESEVDGVVDNR